jgi:hypothetical protein
MGAAEVQRSNSPSIYELVAAAELLKRSHPVEARATIKYLKWLTKRARTHLDIYWMNPWE